MLGAGVRSGGTKSIPLLLPESSSIAPLPLPPCSKMTTAKAMAPTAKMAMTMIKYRRQVEFWSLPLLP